MFYKKSYTASQNMAAKTIQRGYRKYKATKKVPLSTAQTSAVAKIARSVALGTAETKSKLVSTNQQSLDQQVRATNLIFPVTQGDNSEQVVGEKIHLMNIRIRGSIFTGENTSNNSKQVRLMVIQTKDNLTSSNGPISSSSVLRSGSAFPIQEHVDLHKVKCYYDRVLTINNTLAGNVQSIARFFTINVRVNKDMYFESDNSGVLKYGNFYLITVTADGTGPGSPVCRIRADWAVNFKDN